MRAFIDNVNRVPGIKGGLVVGKDGIVILSELKAQMNDERIGALVSGIGVAATRTMSQLKLGSFHRYVIATEYGKLMFVDTGKLYLVAMADASVNVAMCLVEFQAALERLRDDAL